MTEETIGGRLFKAVGGGVLVAVLVVALIAVGYHLITADTRLAAKLDHLAALAGAGLGEPMVVDDAASVARVGERLMADPDIVRLTVRDAEGAIVFHRAQGELADFPAERPLPITQMLIERTAMIDDHGALVGAVSLVASRWALFGAIGPDVAGFGLVTLVLLAALGVVVWRTLGAQVIAPLREMTAEAVSVARQPGAREVPQRQPAREFSVLAEALEYVRVRLHKLGLDSHATEAEIDRRVARRTADLEKANARLAGLAAYDPDTGVFNRDHFLRLANGELAAHRRHGQPTSVLMLDLDAIARIEHGMGPEASRAALSAVAHCIQASLRPTDMVGRLGDDEFGVVLRHTPGDVAATPAARLRQRIETLAFTWQGRKVPLSCAVGVSTCHGADEAMEPVFAQALAALNDNAATADAAANEPQVLDPAAVS